MPNKCFRCGTELIMSGNDEWEAFDGEEANRFYYVCPNCGLDYEVCEPPESQWQEFPYYKNENNTSNEN